MRFATLVVLFLLMLSVTPVRAYAEVKVGDQAPDFGGSEFFNCENADLVKLRGKVVLIHLIHTTSEPCKKQVAEIDKLLEKFGEKGLVVIAVADEKAAKVKAFVEATGAKHPVVAGANDTRNLYGLNKGYPTSLVLDVNGKVKWKGNWVDKAELAVTTALQKVTGRPWTPPGYTSIQKLLDMKKYADGGEELKAAIAKKDLDPETKQRLQAILTWLEKEADTALAKADKLLAAEEWGAARDAYQRVAHDHAGLPGGETAAKALATLLANKAIVRELEAWDFYEQQLAKAKNLDPNDAKGAIKLFKKVISKYRKTKAAAKAQSFLDRLE